MLMIPFSKCDQAFGLWQQVELACEIEPDLRDTVDCWGSQWLVNFRARKTQLVLFDRDVKIDGSALEEKSSCKMRGFSLSSKLNWDSYIVSIANFLEEN